MLFGVPLLYTMEVWWIGTAASPPSLLLALVVAAVPVFLLIRTSGFRTTKDMATVDALGDTVEALAVALLSAAAVLFLLREISHESAVLQAVGKVVYEAVPFAVGAALARSYLQGSRDGADEDSDDGQDDEQDDDGREEGRLHQTAADLGATAIGAMLLAFNIAPTDEIPMLSSPISAGWLVALVGASLALTYAIVFAADFRGTAERRRHRGPLQTPLAETTVAYVVALAVSALLLLFFQRLEPGSPPAAWISNVVVLGFPAAIGGAAGRLAV